MDGRSRAEQSQVNAWIGVDIGGTKTAVVISSQLPSILERTEFSTQPEEGPERAIALIKQSVQQFIKTYGALGFNIRAIGVSCGGPLDQGAGMVQSPPNLPTWVDVPITSILEREFSVECRLENDANAGALAEHQFGAGRNTQHMVFLTMGTGLGAGIIVNGLLLRGASGQAGEIGHVRITRSGPIGYNKAGSVEGWASGCGMAQMAAADVAVAIRRGQSTVLASTVKNGGTLTAKDVAEAAHHGDTLANRIIHKTGRRLGEGLAILIDLFNPECIAIGGLALRLGDRLLEPARQVVRREALPHCAEICQIVPAALGEAIGDVAAICVATRHAP